MTSTNQKILVLGYSNRHTLFKSKWRIVKRDLNQSGNGKEIILFPGLAVEGMMS